MDNQFFPLSAVVCPAWLRARSECFSEQGRQQLTVEKIGCLLILSALPSLNKVCNFSNLRFIWIEMKSPLLTLITLFLVLT